MATALRVRPAYEDPARVRRLIESAGPFWPLTRYAGSGDEVEALGAETRGEFTPPWFRQDFALLGEALVSGAELMLGNPRFVDAAHAIYGEAAVVRPTTVYVNVMGPTPFPFIPHLDVPAFRGFTRADHPIWLLKTMQTSGLFERWRVHIATAVSWFYAGPGGDFYYWPDGPDAPHAVERAPFENVAVVADNEATYHGVGPLGRREDRMPTDLTRESELVRAESGWDVRQDGSTVVHYPDDVVRITVSWKADVFADAAAAERADREADQLDLDTVVSMLLADLHARGVDVDPPRDPHHDREWVNALAATYRDPAPAIAPPS